MLKEFSGDYRVLRVVLSSATPIETLHKLRTGQYSVATFLDLLEMVDVQDTIKEDEEKKYKAEMEKKNKG